MTNYVGLKCPVCGKTFKAGDDIVVCPQCGAPYHRECYAKEGKCVYEDRHGTPDAWSPPKQEENAQENPGERTIRCPRCGYMNSSKARFCEHCGQPLINSPAGWGYQPPYRQPPQSGYPGDVPPPGGTYPPRGSYPAGPMPYPFDPMGGINPKDEIDGVSVEDLSKFVQSNSQYYLPVFMNLKRFMRNRFNFCAFLFSGLWMIYRKMYTLGGIITAVLFGFYLESLYVSAAILTPLYKAMSLQSGGIPDPFTMSSAQIQQMANLFFALPGWQQSLLYLEVAFFVIKIVIMFVSGFVGNRLYMKQCLGQIGRIRSSAKHPDEAEAGFRTWGGVNVVLTMLLAVSYLMISYVIVPMLTQFYF